MIAAIGRDFHIVYVKKKVVVGSLSKADDCLTDHPLPASTSRQKGLRNVTATYTCLPIAIIPATSQPINEQYLPNNGDSLAQVFKWKYTATNFLSTKERNKNFERYRCQWRVTQTFYFKANDPSFVELFSIVRWIVNTCR